MLSRFKFLNSQIIPFGIVAITSVIFELALYTSLFEIFNLDPKISSPIAQIFSLVLNFTLNKLYVFKTGKTLNLKEIIGYLSIWLLNFIVTTVLMSALIGNLEIYPTILRLFVIFVMFGFNFLSEKYLIFKK